MLSPPPPAIKQCEYRWYERVRTRHRYRRVPLVPSEVFGPECPVLVAAIDPIVDASPSPQSRPLPIESEPRTPSPTCKHLPSTSYSPDIAFRTPLTTPETLAVDIESRRSSSMYRRLCGRLNRTRGDQPEKNIRKVTPNFETDRGPHTRPVSRSQRPFKGETKASEHGQISQLLFQLNEHSNEIRNPGRYRQCRRSGAAHDSNIGQAYSAIGRSTTPVVPLVDASPHSSEDMRSDSEDLRILEIEKELRRL